MSAEAQAILAIIGMMGAALGAYVTIRAASLQRQIDLLTARVHQVFEEDHVHVSAFEALREIVNHIRDIQTRNTVMIEETSKTVQRMQNILNHVERGKDDG